MKSFVLLQLLYITAATARYQQACEEHRRLEHGPTFLRRTQILPDGGGALISNGLISLGVDEQGQLNVPGPPSANDDIPFVGLRYFRDGEHFEATADGCLCEGWGGSFRRTNNGKTYSGSANNDDAVRGLITDPIVSDGTNATTVVTLTDLKVTHHFFPSPDTPNLYQVRVTYENIGRRILDQIRYRRVMDWDIPPTAFNECVTIDVGNSASLEYASDNGILDADPTREDADPLDRVGRAPTFACPNGEGCPVYDSGPLDHGALFQFLFKEDDGMTLLTLAPNETLSFDIFYGAAGNKVDAAAAVEAVGAEVFSFGYPPMDVGCNAENTGAPNTFIFAFRGVGGDPIPPLQADSNAPSSGPSVAVSFQPSQLPSGISSDVPSLMESNAPTRTVSGSPTAWPSAMPSQAPSVTPSSHPSELHSRTPSLAPTAAPSVDASNLPTLTPSTFPTASPSSRPSEEPTTYPSQPPTAVPSTKASNTPSTNPSDSPSATSGTPSQAPSVAPSMYPSQLASNAPSHVPSAAPSAEQSNLPTLKPSPVPSASPSSTPSVTPSNQPTSYPSQTPSASASVAPSQAPSIVASSVPTVSRSVSPSVSPVPSYFPSGVGSAEPSGIPSSVLSSAPSNAPSLSSSQVPTALPSDAPTPVPTSTPTAFPTANPTPTPLPTSAPTTNPTTPPTSEPTQNPTAEPTSAPTAHPTMDPTVAPTSGPTTEPCPPTLTRVTGFKLVNIRTLEEFPIHNGDTFNTADVGQNLTLVADTSGPVQSVAFDLNGARAVQTENVVPYALNGDIDGDFFKVTEFVSNRRFVVTATPFSGPDRQGCEGESLEVEFGLIDYCGIEGIVLVDPVTDLDVLSVEDGTIVPEDTLEGVTRLTLRVDYCGTVESVVFDFDGVEAYNIENFVPFSLGDDTEGDYQVAPGLIRSGEHTVSFQPFSSGEGSGFPLAEKTTVTLTLP